MRLEHDVPLARHTSLNVGGLALFFCEAKPQELDGVLALGRRMDVPLLVLGSGTNVLIADEGFPGLVVTLGWDDIRERIREVPEMASRARTAGTLVAVDAGVEFDEFVTWAIARNLQGVECLAGIPGTVGAAPVQNIGAYGQQVSDTIQRVYTVHRDSGEYETIPAHGCRFGYRSSIFNRTPDGAGHIILAVEFLLIPNGVPARRHAQLANIRGGVAEMARAVRAIRRGKGMLAGQHRSAGSFFKNASVQGVRVPAAQLMERAGYHKGDRWGNVGLSADHVLAIETFAGASAPEVVQVVRDIQKQVCAVTDVLLEPEVQPVGFQVNPFL